MEAPGEKNKKSTHRMESLKQTAEERYFWNVTIFRFLLKLGDTPGGLECVPVFFFFFFFYISRSAVVVSEIMEIVCIYICTVTTLSKYLNPSDYSWCKNGTFFLSLTQKNTDYYHSTRGPKCNSLLQTVCRYILIVKTTFCASMFFPQGLK